MSMPDRLKDGEKGAAILYSGGMDSTVILAHLLKEGYTVFPITMDEGSNNFKLRRVVAIEESLKQFNVQHREVRCRVQEPERLRVSKDTFGFVPGYKMLMIMTALSHCHVLNVDELWLGYNLDNQRHTYHDEGSEFMDACADLFYKAYGSETNTDFPFGRKIKIMNPFFDKSKGELTYYGHTLGVDYSTTISCRQVKVGAGIVHCGECTVCKRRRIAFIEAGIKDPTLWYPNSTCDRNRTYINNIQPRLTDGWDAFFDYFLDVAVTPEDRIKRKEELVAVMSAALRDQYT